MASNAIFYTDANGNFYVNENGDYYIYRDSFVNKKLTAYIMVNGVMKKVVPYILKVTNMGPVPDTAMMSSARDAFLTKDQEFFVAATGSKVTDVGSDDYILYEFIKYAPEILYSNAQEEAAKIALMTNAKKVFLTKDSKLFMTK